MSNINDYYIKLSQDILTYIQQKKYDEVIEIIDNELMQPYIPNEHYLNLLHTKEEIISKIKEEEYEKQIDSLSKLQIWDYIYDINKHEIDLVYLSLLFSKFANHLDEVDYGMMQKILNDQKMLNTQKTILISTLLDNNIDHQFTYYNNFLQQSFSFDLKTVSNNQAMQEAEKILNQLEQIYLKDPSKLQIANSLVQLLIIEYFPTPIDASLDLIIESIENVIESLFDQRKIKNNKITNILVKYIN